MPRLVSPILASVPAWPLALFAFLVAMLAALRGAAWFTHELEAVSDRWMFSPGLLSLVSALGANAPNYTASLAAFATGQPVLGLGIIIGSNIYNGAVILGLATLAVPAGRGIRLRAHEALDALRVASLAAAMALTTLLTLLLLAQAHAGLPASAPRTVDALTLGLFALLGVHAVRHGAHRPQLQATARAESSEASRSVSRALLGLALALGSVIVMVRAGQVAAQGLRLPPALLSLVVLAVATSLPNTVVAYRLARDDRALTCVEEVLSSNGINVALGSALPLVFWRSGQLDPLLMWVDMPLAVALALFALAATRAGRLSRPMGAALIVVYGAWVLVRVLV